MQRTDKSRKTNICDDALKMKTILGLESEPVGVKFTTGTDAPENAENLGHHRYCQALMLARGGRSIFKRRRFGLSGGLYLFPLAQADVEPDVVIVEDDVEKLMWISLADLHRRKGNRVESSTAILQATCVDATVIPYLEQRLNLSYGCYGCRDATDIRASETVLGFPASALAVITEHLEYLGEKAITHSRSKKAYRMLDGGKEDRDHCAEASGSQKK